MFKRIDHTEIIPRDVEGTIDFYTRILNFKVKERKKVEAPPLREIIYLELNGTVLEILSVDHPSPPSSEPWQVGYRMIALEVTDMDQAVRFLKSQGIDLSWGPVDLGSSQRAEILDPNGLPIELRQWKKTN